MLIKKKQKKTRFHRKNRKLHRFFSILEKKRRDASCFSKKCGYPLEGGALMDYLKSKETKIIEKKNEISDIQDKNKDQINVLQKDTNFTNQQELIARKDLISGLEQKKIDEEAKLTKEMAYKNQYNVLSTSAELAGKTGVAFMVANVAMGALTASGVGIPAAGGIAVCLILVNKLMKKYKQLKELQILLLDMNTILTNCYYLENMINKVLTVFQIYINDFTEDKKYYSKIITVDNYYNLHDSQSCKNIAILVQENKEANAKKLEGGEPIEEDKKSVLPPPKTEFLNKTKILKGYNLGERIQNAKQLFIDGNGIIDAVIDAEKKEYDAFGNNIDNNNQNNYINIDDDDALESLLKFMIYKRIEEGLKSCQPSENSQSNENQQKSTNRFYDDESKIIYKIGVNPDIKYRIKQKLDIIRDLLIDIDPESAQRSRDIVELNESLDKIEEKAFTALDNNPYSEWITYSYSSYETPSSYSIFSSKNKTDLSYTFDCSNNNSIDTESKLDTYLSNLSIINDIYEINAEKDKQKNKQKKIEKKIEIDNMLNSILCYWFKIKQQNIPIGNYLILHKQEWINYLKKCFLKVEFYRKKKVVDNNSYSNYEDWVRAFLTAEINKTNNSRSIWTLGFKTKTIKDSLTTGKQFLTADNKTKQLMNTLNSLNALFIIINSQFEMTLKYYDRALKFDYTKTKENENYASVNEFLDLFGFSKNKNNKNKRGIDHIWELCESTVSYQKFLLPPDFNEDKKAILNQVEVEDFTEKTETKE